MVGLILWFMHIHTLKRRIYIPRSGSIHGASIAGFGIVIILRSTAFIQQCRAQFHVAKHPNHCGHQSRIPPNPVMVNA